MPSFCSSLLQYWMERKWRSAASERLAHIVLYPENCGSLHIPRTPIPLRLSTHSDHYKTELQLSFFRLFPYRKTRNARATTLFPNPLTYWNIMPHHFTLSPLHSFTNPTPPHTPSSPFDSPKSTLHKESCRTCGRIRAAKCVHQRVRLHRLRCSARQRHRSWSCPCIHCRQ